MNRYINEHGKECYENVTPESPFSGELFHEVKEVTGEEKHFAFHSNLGSLTVLDRMTGFGWRDIESGYRSKTDDFWLATGNIDIRESGCMTVGEAIDYVKAQANTCVPEGV